MELEGNDGRTAISSLRCNRNPDYNYKSATDTGFIHGDDSMSNVRHITSKFHHLSASSAGAARLAQSVEHQTFNLRVMGSSPILGDFIFFLSRS